MGDWSLKLGEPVRFNSVHYVSVCSFQEHVMSEPVTGVVSRTELVRLRGEVRDASGAQPQLDLPPGEDEPVDHIVRTNTDYIIMFTHRPLFKTVISPVWSSSTT